MEESWRVLPNYHVICGTDGPARHRAPRMRYTHRERERETWTTHTRTHTLGHGHADTRPGSLRSKVLREMPGWWRVSRV